MDAKHITQMGLMNKLTTGNFIADILICFMIPMVMDSDIFATLKHWFRDGVKMVLTRIYPVKQKVQRIITYSYSFGERGINSGHNSMTERVQWAIDHYMSKKAKMWVSQSNSATISVDSCSDTLLMKTPPDTWIQMDAHTRLKVNKIDSGSVATSKYTDITYTVECAESSEYVDALLNQIYNDYVLFTETNNYDRKRYMYVPNFTRNVEKGYQKAPLDRYALSSNKTFDVLFTPQKAELIRLVDQFQNKTGKFGVTGYPYKLGFLLHGEPGTGKTTFIKALAHYTNRSIISIPLNAISTNNQLMQLMFSNNLAYQSSHDDWSYAKIDFSKVIYVIEDIDVASNVVHKRESGADNKNQSSQNQTNQSKQSKKKGILSKCTDVCEVDGLDSLNLAGLLNVLDGVVDTPGRILIMTTNHPEVLDPALIRPGRINMKIHMQYMVCEDAISMIEHYIGKMTTEERTRFVAGYPKNAKVSPATIEALCLGVDTVAEAIDKMKTLVPPLCL